MNVLRGQLLPRLRLALQERAHVLPVHASTALLTGIDFAIIKAALRAASAAALVLAREQSFPRLHFRPVTAHEGLVFELLQGHVRRTAGYGQ